MTDPVRLSSLSRATLPSGAPGKSGLLRLELGPRAGRTRLLAVEQRVPLHLGRALYPQSDWPSLAQLFVAMPTGGLVQGDSIEIEILAHPGTEAQIASQSATRAYRCEAGDVRQSLRLTVEAQAYLEWWPEPLIPFAGAAFAQLAEIELDAGATLLFADTLLLGRVARGEVNAYQRLSFRTVARRPDGAVLFRDALLLEPNLGLPSALGLLGDATAIGTFYLLGPVVASALEVPLAEELGQHRPVEAAVTRLPNDAGLLVRAVCRHSESLREVQAAVLRVSRRILRAHAVGEPLKP